VQRRRQRRRAGGVWPPTTCAPSGSAAVAGSRATAAAFAPSTSSSFTASRPTLPVAPRTKIMTSPFVRAAPVSQNAVLRLSYDTGIILDEFCEAYNMIHVTPGNADARRRRRLVASVKGLLAELRNQLSLFNRQVGAGTSTPVSPGSVTSPKTRCVSGGVGSPMRGSTDSPIVPGPGARRGSPLCKWLRSRRWPVSCPLSPACRYRGGPAQSWHTRRNCAAS
jgi:hypothetical protein